MRFQGISKILGRFSLKKMFLMCVIFFILIPFTLITLVIRHQAGSQISTQAYDNMLQALVQSQENVSSFLRETENVSLDLLSDENVQSYIKYFRHADGLDQSVPHDALSVLDSERIKFLAMEVFRKAFAEKPYLRGFLISEDGKAVLRFGETVYNENTPHHQAALALGGRVVWTPAYSEFYQFAARDRLMISCIREVRDLNSGRHLALQRLSFEEQTLCDIYSSVYDENEAQRFIVNSAGLVVSSPDQKAINRPMTLFDAALIKDSPGYTLFDDNGSKKSLFYSAIDGTDWVLVQITPQRVITGALDAINMVIFFFIAVFLLFCAFFIAVQNRCVVLPIVRLSREMEKVKQGIFETNIDIPSENEIGKLTYLFLDMTDSLKNLFETVYKARLREREAELRALQSQISPHFLYNSLASIYWLAYRNKDYEVGKQVESLSNLFRHTLNNGVEITTIGKELNHLESYMYLQKSKLGDRIRLETDMDESLNNCKTIKLILQPLVENALYHGLECKQGSGTVSVSIKREDEKIVITVKDDGLGTDGGKIRALLLDDSQTDRVFALKNIEQRIKLRYGEPYGLEFYSEVNCGTTVVVTIPFEQ